ncbi:MAG: hypothetical protein ACI9FR_000053 [Cryomorphaceae bacterium]|jgi:hypothetical protein
MAITTKLNLTALKSFSLCCFLAVMLLAASSKAHATEAEYETILMKDGIYMLSGVGGSSGGNVGVSID